MCEKNINTKEEYNFFINDEEEICIKKIKSETSQEINIIFDKENNTNIMEKIIETLTEIYIEDILKMWDVKIYTFFFIDKKW